MCTCKDTYTGITDTKNHIFIVNNNRQSVLLATNYQEAHAYPNMGYSPTCNIGVESYQKDIECAGHTQTNKAAPSHMEL